MNASKGLEALGMMSHKAINSNGAENLLKQLPR
jgi:hypothetical protein